MDIQIASKLGLLWRKTLHVFVWTNIFIYAECSVGICLIVWETVFYSSSSVSWSFYLASLSYSGCDFYFRVLELRVYISHLYSNSKKKCYSQKKWRNLTFTSITLYEYFTRFFWLSTISENSVTWSYVLIRVASKCTISSGYSYTLAQNCGILSLENKDILNI